MFKKDFTEWVNSPIAPERNYSGNRAHTLQPEDVGTHESGWTIIGEIHEDYYKWVNYFEAAHPEYGKVWGNFEGEVFADSEAAYNHFVEHHPPEEWDYWDI